MHEHYLEFRRYRPIVILLLESINSLYSWAVQCNIIFLQGEGKQYYKKK